MKSKSLTEVFSDRARLQLSFWSYMNVAFFAALGISVISTFLLNYLAEVGYRASGQITTTSIYGFLFINFGLLILGVFGSAISYPIYSMWCNKARGQVVSGRIAVLVESSNESLNSTSQSDVI